MSWHACAPDEATPLERLAQNLLGGDGGELRTSPSHSFEMYVVAADVVISMKELVPHETLLANGSLNSDESQGNAMFVSHQWASSSHPDPNMEQFCVLQDALKNIMSGACSISGNISFELYTGGRGNLSADQMSAKRLFVWYDFFSCPQSASAEQPRQLAIRSIPTYVDRCQFFIILCPPVQHTEQEFTLNRRSWESRGWCRLERMAQELTTRADACFAVEFKSATHHEEVAPFGREKAPVGLGHFTVESDRQMIAQVLQGMVRRKLHSYLLQGEVHNYRLMLNLQRVHYRGLPLNPIDDLVPAVQSGTQDPAKFAAESFLLQNGFQSVSERTAAGWTPVCFAALDGSPLLMMALLEMRANVDDRIENTQPSSTFGQNAHLIHMCAFLSNNDALHVLLGCRADLRLLDRYGATALHWAAFANNVNGIDALLSAGVDPIRRNILDATAFRVGALAGSIEAIKVLLPLTPSQEVHLSVHDALLHGAGTAEVMSALITMKADVNHQLATPFLSPLGIWFGCLSLRHRWSESKLSAYAYHHYGATPLMGSIITTSFEATKALLAAGARTDLRNARGRTAADLAIEMGAPDYVLSALADPTYACISDVGTEDSDMCTTKL
ncbi:Kinase D-interacting substrate of 220 kDa [Symbiodinium microadriaticum]|uniref:Kinase D-interacting substrate of 220 kDa n=1 Tax=Symbiodinium microadriaticum TaxID=2951 RepID=A0A1Q9D6I1_SYMMI|nr:Kinase D-interacting substrate of 220 kDa [Symbiodinium microadriaticum]CAE7600803.1 unnamed protein product [Symbiodinium microadriaticum]CAE7944056.1 unnamed protein product [Symbiodinium sp. KB8]